MTQNAEAAPASNPLKLVRYNPTFRWLWLSRTISVVGNALGLVALVLQTTDTGGQGLAVALLMLVGDFAPTLLSPLSGALGDRFDRKRLMILCELAQGLLISLIALVGWPWPLFLLLVGLRTTLGQVFGAASSGAVPALVGPDELEPANVALGFGTTGLELLGPLLSALLLPFLSINGLLLVDAATFFVSALLLSRLPALPPISTETEEDETGETTKKGSLLAEARAGLVFIWENRALRTLTLGFFAVVAFTGIDDVALVFLAKDTLGAGDSGASLLYAGAGAGLLLGYAFLTGFSRRWPLLVMLLVGYTLSCSGNLLTGLAWALPVAFLTQAGRGVGLSLVDTANNTLIQRLVPGPLLGRAFGNVYGAIGLAAALSYTMGGLLVNLLGPRLVFVIAGSGGLVATLVLALTLPGLVHSATGQTSQE